MDARVMVVVYVVEVMVEVSVAQYSRNLGSRPSCTLEVASEGTTLSSLEIVALIETGDCKDDI